MVTSRFSSEASKENIKTLFIQLENKFVLKTLKKQDVLAQWSV